MNNKKIPWNNLLKTSFSKFGILPKDFWEMTFKELLILLDESSTEELIIQKYELQDLINLFPDN